MDERMAMIAMALLVAIDEVGRGAALVAHMEENGIGDAESALEDLRGYLQENGA